MALLARATLPGTSTGTREQGVTSAASPTAWKRLWEKGMGQRGHCTVQLRAKGTDKAPGAPEHQHLGWPHSPSAPGIWEEAQGHSRVLPRAEASPGSQALRGSPAPAAFPW